MQCQATNFFESICTWQNTTEDMLVMAWQILYTKTENNKAILFSVMAEGAAKARVRVSIMGPYLCGSLRPSSTHAHYQSRRNPEAGEGAMDISPLQILADLEANTFPYQNPF